MDWGLFFYKLIAKFANSGTRVEDDVGAIREIKVCAGSVTAVPDILLSWCGNGTSDSIKGELHAIS